jgi:hypothetical protein
MAKLSLWEFIWPNFFCALSWHIGAHFLSGRSTPVPYSHRRGWVFGSNEAEKRFTQN